MGNFLGSDAYKGLGQLASELERHPERYRGGFRDLFLEHIKFLHGSKSKPDKSQRFVARYLLRILYHFGNDPGCFDLGPYSDEQLQGLAKCLRIPREQLDGTRDKFSRWLMERLSRTFQGSA